MTDPDASVWAPGPRVRGAGGVEVATWDLGGDGPPVLLLHATGFHAKTWVPAAAALRATHRVWALDQRGHGASGHAPDGDYRDWSGFVDDVLAVVDALGLGDATSGLCGAGHSLGGGILLLAEQARPGLFRALYCYEPIVVAPAQRAHLVTDNTGLAAISRKRRAAFPSRRAARENYAAKLPFAAFDPSVLDAYVEHGFVDLPDGTVTLACPPLEESSMYEGALRHRAWEHLGDNRAPLTLAGCTGDGPAVYLDALAARHVAATVQRWPDLTHFGPMERPDLVGRAIADALAP